MNWEDRLSMVSHMVNFSIAIYLFSIAFLTESIKLINPTLTFSGLIFAVSLNIIGVLIVLKKKK